MADVTINYEGNAIATMSASGTKTLLTEGKYCTDDIEVVYVSPGGGGGSLSPILDASITIAGGNTRDLTATLPNTVTNAVIMVEADDATKSTIYSNTSDTYYKVISAIVFFPKGSLVNGENIASKFNAIRTVRPSTGGFQSTYTFTTIDITGTTLSIQTSGSTVTFLGGGTYNVKVWEVSLT